MNEWLKHPWDEKTLMKALERVISGGQTGVDQAALRAASGLRIPTGGTAPKNYLTEDGPCRRLGTLYGLKATDSAAYLPRTIQNVEDSNMTLLIGSVTGGTKTTAELCLRLQRPAFFIARDALLREGTSERTVKKIITEYRRRSKPIVLNVSGNRESKSPGIGAEAENFLMIVFMKLLNPRELL